MPYDPRCKELAAWFLQDGPEKLRTEEEIDLLAQVIQDTVEDWIATQADE